MTSGQIKRGFRRIGWTLLIPCLVAALAGATYSAYLYASGPNARCPNLTVDIPVRREWSEEVLQGFAKACTTRHAENPFSKYVQRPEPTRQDYLTAYHLGVSAWDDQRKFYTLISAALFAAGLAMFAAIEVLSWIVRGFMRD